MILTILFKGIEEFSFFEANKEIIAIITNLVTIVGIVGSLIFTAVSIRSNTKTTKISNQFLITQFHRDIWSLTFDKPELKRILKDDPNTKKISKEEKLFVRFLIFHLKLSYDAIRAKAIIQPEKLDDDIKNFFSKPIPSKVWEDIKDYQNKDFVKYVEDRI